MRNLIYATLLLIFGTVISASAQDLVAGYLAADSLDALPKWNMDSLRQAACVRVCCPGTTNDAIAAHAFEGEVYVTVENMANAWFDCDLEKCCRGAYLLAWQQWRAVKGDYSERTALMLVEHGDSSATSRWTLVKLYSIDSRGGWLMASGEDATNGAYETIRTFEALPTGAQILETVKSWESSKGGFFAANLKGRRSKFLLTESGGADLDLTAGGIRKKTWKKLLGENPTIAFPEGNAKKGK